MAATRSGVVVCHAGLDWQGGLKSSFFAALCMLCAARSTCDGLHPGLLLTSTLHPYGRAVPCYAINTTQDVEFAFEKDRLSEWIADIRQIIKKDLRGIPGWGAHTRSVCRCRQKS